MERKVVEHALVELGELLDLDVETESQYQAWFERHPVVFLALGYRRVIPHPRILDTAGKLWIPDFLVELPDGDWEIFELKTPQAAVLQDRERRSTFYATFQKYVSQCHEYADLLDDRSTRELLHRRTGVDLQKSPQSVIVAGRSGTLDRAKVRQLCRHLNPPIKHYTFDDIKRHLENYRLFNFGAYDKAGYLAIFAAVHIDRPDPPGQVNHIIDFCETPEKNHVSITVDSDDRLRLAVWDSNGRLFEARASRPLTLEDYQHWHVLYCEIGGQEDFGFLTIELDRYYHADLRVPGFPFEVGRGLAIGTNAEGSGQSWVGFRMLAVYEGPMSLERRREIRERVEQRIIDLYTNPGRKVPIFSGHGFGVSAKHPASKKLNEPPPQPSADLTSESS
jgi:hypothetical protein